MGGGGAIFEQSRGCIYQGTGADAGQKRNLSALKANPVELSLIRELSPGALATRVDEHIQGRRIGVRMLSLDNEPFGTTNEPA